jgi:hypothetical protein
LSFCHAVHFYSRQPSARVIGKIHHACVRPRYARKIAVSAGVTRPCILETVVFKSVTVLCLPRDAG